MDKQVLGLVILDKKREIKNIFNTNIVNLENIKTRERGLKSLLKASIDLNCDDLKIITYYSEEKLKIKGKAVSLIPIWK